MEMVGICVKFDGIVKVPQNESAGRRYEHAYQNTTKGACNSTHVRMMATCRTFSVRSSSKYHKCSRPGEQVYVCPTM
ncbi:hypothetical protein SeMB42_g05978 [Synchytrium endobioticum]|uniref:Uncharacterized protein n=1 Tax=Synchytrium endobioticum TaxID=286115 RepID=A0A507CMX3_9FUNG|nr:hypothetical protein SeMB42_g05978 [Synchytrium endobioticum]